jgi:hypothetical protein
MYELFVSKIFITQIFSGNTVNLLTMKKYFVSLFLLLFLVGSSACQRKSGCPTAEYTKVKLNKKGELSSKGGKSQLFPKNMRRG